MNPLSTSQILAQKAQTDRATTQEALLAAAPAYRPVHAANGIGQTVAGSNQIMQALQGYDQNKVNAANQVTQQSNLDKAEALRLEQQQYDRTRQGVKDTQDAALAKQRATESSLRVKDMNLDLTKKQEAELLKQGQAATAQAGQDWLNSRLNPVREASVKNTALYQEAMKTGGLTLQADPETGTVSYAPVSPLFKSLADDFNKKLLPTDTVGNPAEAAAQVRALADKLNHDNNKHNDMAPEAEAQLLAQLEQAKGTIGSLTGGQETKLKGELTQMDETFKKDFQTKYGKLDVSTQTLANDLDHMDKLAAEGNAPTFNGASEFIKKYNFDTDSANYINNQITRYANDVKAAFNEGEVVNYRTGEKTTLGKKQWHDKYLQLAIQNVLKASTTRDGVLGWFDVNDNDIMENRFKKELKAEMQRIADFHQKHTKMQDDKNAHEKAKAVKRLKALAQAGYASK